MLTDGRSTGVWKKEELPIKNVKNNIMGYLRPSAALYNLICIVFSIVVFCMLRCTGCYITNHIFLIYKK